MVPPSGSGGASRAEQVRRSFDPLSTLAVGTLVRGTTVAAGHAVYIGGCVPGVPLPTSTSHPGTGSRSNLAALARSYGVDDIVGEGLGEIKSNQPKPTQIK